MTLKKEGATSAPAEIAKESSDIDLTPSGPGLKLIPRSLEEAKTCAQFLATTGMVPDGYIDKATGRPRINAMIGAIVWGCELGFSALRSLQSIDNVPGRKPALNVDAKKSLVWGSGLCEYIEDEIMCDSSGNLLGVRCRAKRKDVTRETVSVFTVDMAKKAGLWGRPGPWTQYPQRMLTARAVGYALNDTFADVLGGITLTTDESRDMHGDPYMQTVEATMPALEHHETLDIPLPEAPPYPDDDDAR